MSTTIASRYPPGTPELRMTNGTTAVVFDLLALAAFELASRPWELGFARWIANHDQTRVGLGCLDVDLVDLGWTRDGFSGERRFVLAVLDAALRGCGRDRLPFEPALPVVEPPLEQLRAMVLGLDAEVVTLANPDAFTVRDAVGNGRCDRHRVELHPLGCIVCNDAPVDATADVAPFTAARVSRLVERAIEAVREQRGVRLPVSAEWHVRVTTGQPVVHLDERSRDEVPLGDIYTTFVVHLGDVPRVTHYRSRRGEDGDATLPP